MTEQKKTDPREEKPEVESIDDDALENASGGRLMPPPPVKLGPYDT